MAKVGLTGCAARRAASAAASACCTLGQRGLLPVSRRTGSGKTSGVSHRVECTMAPKKTLQNLRIE
jgi:hypothetical protein